MRRLGGIEVAVGAEKAKFATTMRKRTEWDWAAAQPFELPAAPGSSLRSRKERFPAAQETCAFYASLQLFHCMPRHQKKPATGPATAPFYATLLPTTSISGKAALLTMQAARVTFVAFTAAALLACALAGADDKEAVIGEGQRRQRLQ